MSTRRRLLALSISIPLSMTFASGFVACHGRDAETPRTDPRAADAADAAHADAGPAASASSSARTVGPSASVAPCPPLPEAAARATKGPCARGSDCALANVGCCPSCSPPSKCSYAAVPRSAVGEFSRAVCPSPRGCPKCDEGMPPQRLPFCREARCEVVDVPSDAISACERDADCVVRDWACCTPCDASPVYPIAIRRDAMATYDEQVCSMAGSCARCKTGMQGYRARCDAGTKHCVVE